MTEHELICVIVNFGQGSKALKIAKRNKVRGGTICLGRGTVKNKLLEFLDLTDVRKEIVFMIAETDTAKTAMQAIYKEMAMRKPNHGIGFTISLNNFITMAQSVFQPINQDEVVNKTVYNAIFTVVDKGRAEDVIDAATAAGARGGTIINARGSGIHETSILFAMPVEPEKEMVLILAEAKSVENIVANIREKLKIDLPGNGIIFVMGINEAYGLYSNN